MLMHIITNFTGNAGAEAMLSRLIREPSNSLVVPLMGVSDRYRNRSGRSVRYRPLNATSVPKMLLAVPRLAKIIHDERPSAILCWMYHAMIAGTLARRMSGGTPPIFWNVRQSLDDLAVLSRSTRTALKLCRSLSADPDGIIFNSARAAELHKCFGFCNVNTRVIPNGFDPVDAELPGARRPRIFGIAARFHPQKDHRTFFEAAALLSRRYPDARFVAAGAGLHKDNEAIRQLIAASGLSMDAVALRGELDDMSEFYRDIDVLVLSSLTEGFPNVVAEAMSYGRPVATTDVGDAGAIVRETGFVVPPGDPQELAAAMERMLCLSPVEYQKHSIEARRRIVDHYSLQSIVRQYERFIGEI